MNAEPILEDIARALNIIRSKRALGRPRDLAVMDVLEKTLHEKEKQ